MLNGYRVNSWVFYARIVLLLALVVVGAAAAGPVLAQSPTEDSDSETAKYEIKLKGQFDSDALAAGVAVPAGAGFSGMVGAMHNSSVSFWTESEKASDGLETLAEIGSFTDFEDEMGDAVDGGNALDSFGSSWSALGATENGKTLLKPTRDFPLVSLAVRISPSPDWFVGVDSLNLRSNGKWLEETTIDLYPLDAGTEDGTEFDNLNSATTPQGTIESLKGSGKFSDDPIARLVIKLRQPPKVKGVSAQAGEEEITVSWDAVDVATGYKVQWKSGSEGFEDASTDGREYVVQGGTVIEHTVSSLTAGTEYTLQVIAVNQVGDGKPSDEVSATPEAAPDPDELDDNDILVSNVNGGSGGVVPFDTSAQTYEQGFTTGKFTARIDKITFPSPRSVTADSELNLRIYEDDDGERGRRLHTLNAPADITVNDDIVFTAPASTGITLAQDTSYILRVARVAGTTILHSTGDGAEDSESDPGWSLADECSGCTASRAFRVTIEGESFLPAQISVSDSDADEGSNVEFTVSLSHTMPNSVTVQCTTTDGTASSDPNATDGRDFEAAVDQTVTFAAGETTKTVSIVTIDDTILESDETFTITLSGPSDNAEISESDSATGTILNNDVALQTDATLSALTVSDDDTTLTLTPAFASGVTDYTVSVANDVESVTVVGTKNDDGATVQVVENDGTTTADQATVTLAVGANPIKVEVTAEDGTTKKVYNVVVTRDEPPFDPVVWTAELTAGSRGSRAPATTGYSLWGVDMGSVSSQSFELDGNQTRVLTVMRLAEGLYLNTSRAIPQNFFLTVGSLVFQATDSLEPPTPGRGRYWWPAHSISWSAGDTVDVSITVIPDSDAPSGRSPAPPSVYATQIPSSHNGVDSFTFRLQFTEEFPLSFRTLKRNAFEVTGGAIQSAKRVTKGANKAWTITVQPSGTGDVTISLPVTQDCEAAGAICDSDGTNMHNSLEFVVSGPGSS